MHPRQKSVSRLSDSRKRVFKGTRAVPSRVNEVRNALNKIKRGEAEPEEVLETYSHIDGIERSVSVALAKREQDMDEDFEDEWQADFTLE